MSEITWVGFSVKLEGAFDYEDEEISALRIALEDATDALPFVRDLMIEDVEVDEE